MVIGNGKIKEMVTSKSNEIYTLPYSMYTFNLKHSCYVSTNLILIN